jgi:hypothetical protein
MSTVTKEKDVIDLSAYRRRRVKAPAAREAPAPKDAEQALKEIARYLLMAVCVITDRKMSD